MPKERRGGKVVYVRKNGTVKKTGNVYTEGNVTLEHIDVNPNWAYQPDDQTDLKDMVKNPIPFVGVGKDMELANLFYGDGTTIQTQYLSDTTIDISKLQTLQPFVLKSGVTNYKSWDNSARPYVVEFEGKYYLLDGNHRVATAKLKGQKTIKVDISRQSRKA